MTRGDKRGQATIFIIVGIVIVALVIAFFVFKNSLSDSGGLPKDIQPVYNALTSCLEEDVSVGIDVLGTQGGYIYMPEFEPGSSYMPFSSQLDFAGSAIPYWYYVSGNNVPKEQVPTLREMELQLEEFIENEARNCVLNEYYDKGYEIYLGEPKADVIIRDNEVELKLEMPLQVNYLDESAIVNNHLIKKKSNLGELYNSAKAVYGYQQENLFLEDYAIDNLRLYAPVDGVELSCSPMTWNANEVFDELKSAIEGNTLALRSKGGDFNLVDDKNKYFVLDLPTDKNVRFINSKNWSSSFEVAPSEGSVLISKPVGNQPGLGVIGFCYVPYHFVYNVKYPVLVQINEGEEIFQFPMAVIVQGNEPRKPLDVSAEDFELTQLCEYKNTPVNVRIYDNELTPIEADISFECFGTRCEIGKASYEGLEEDFPQCVNGFVIASAEGYNTGKQIYSTTQSGEVELFLDKIYELDVELSMDGIPTQNDAIISFLSEDFSRTIIYPETKKIELVEGNYDIQVHAYKNTSFTIESTKQEECFQTPRAGIGGFFGLTKEKCVEVEIPSQLITNSLTGGGKQEYYILEDELKSGKLKLNADSLPKPNSIEELQNNYLAFEENKLEVSFG